MRKLLLLILALPMVLGCHKNKIADKPCNPGICTAMFASINVRFVDKSGEGVALKSFTVTNTRTGKPITYIGANTVDLSGYQTIANDADLKELSEEGDILLVSATNRATNETITANFKVAGGCVCHVSKIFGPDVITFTR